jgi:hypothetical protein
MTNPLSRAGADGALVAEVVVDGSHVADDFEDELDAAGRRGDTKIKKIGEDWSETLDGELQRGVKDTGDKMARTITKDFERTGFKPTKFVTELDSDNNVIRRWVTEIEDKMERAVKDEVASGGFNKVSLAVRDAVGSGFNVSGKSPLIAFLIPLVGIIAELVLGAIQAANALAALVTIIPNVIGGAVLQVGVLFLAFKGLGQAIQGAFAAKNTDELKKALEGLTPAAQDFVKSLLPLRDLFKQIQSVAQENFFVAFGNSVSVVAKKLGGVLTTGVGNLATALGNLGRTIVTFFADPVFIRFLNILIPSTIRWIEGFGPAVGTLLTGLANLGAAVSPLADWFGEKLNNALADFGQWLSDLSQDQGFLRWLEDMKGTLTDVWHVLENAVELVATLANTLDKAGGDGVLKDIADQLAGLNAVFASDLGQKAIEGLIHLVQVLAYSFIYLVAGIVGVLILFELVLEFLKNGLGPWIADFFSNKVPEFFAALGDLAGELGMVILNALGTALGAVISFLLNAAAAVAFWFHDRWIDITSFFGSLPGMISDAFGNAINTLYNAGRNLIQGLINGILSMLGPVGNAMTFIADKIKGYLPHSPAKEGPLSGDGDPLKGGQEIGDRLAAGIAMSGPTIDNAMNSAVSGIVVGQGAVQMNFYGQTPSRSEAAGIGAAAGNSFADSVLTRRDTRLAIRAM